MEWQPVDGIFRQVSVNLAGVWALNTSGDVFYRVGTFENYQSPGTRWWQVEGKLANISVGWNVVWVVDAQGGVWYRDGIDIDHVVGTKWVQVPTLGPFKQVSVGRMGQVWAIDYKHDVYFRVGACLKSPGGGFWNKVGPGSVLLQQVSSGGEDMMVGVTRRGELYIRAGMNPQCPTGTQWKRLVGDLGMVDVYGHRAWGIDFGGRPVSTMMWPYSQEPVRPLHASYF
ncbi:hypothetical protein ACOMHN_000596 [Nucella lapillus]